MFASSALLGTICAAGLYCRVYWVFISSASRRRPGLGGKEENAVTVAAVLMLSGCLCTNWLGSLFQLCISLLAMVAHLRWVAAGTGLGQYYGGDEPESTLEQLLWSSAADQDNQLKHAVALVCPGSTLMALATCSLITQNPVLFGIFLVESRISFPHQMGTRGRWKPDSYWRAVLYEQAKVMSRIDPDLVESAGGTTRAFAQRFELSQLELEPDGKMWWRGCGRQASGQCDSLRLTATLGLNNPPCCRSHLTSMIEQISSLMNELSLPHWIDGSTLLAAVRHKMIMPWCSSASFTFVPPDGKPDHARLVQALEHAGFTLLNSEDGETHTVLWGKGPWLSFGDAELLRCAVGASPRVSISAITYIDEEKIGVFRKSKNQQLYVICARVSLDYCTLRCISIYLCVWFLADCTLS